MTFARPDGQSGAPKRPWGGTGVRGGANGTSGGHVSKEKGDGSGPQGAGGSSLGRPRPAPAHGYLSPQGRCDRHASHFKKPVVPPLHSRSPETGLRAETYVSPRTKTHHPQGLTRDPSPSPVTQVSSETIGFFLASSKSRGHGPGSRSRRDPRFETDIFLGARDPRRSSPRVSRDD